MTTMTTTARVLAEYGVSKTLGAGSMGKVKLAVHHATGQKVPSFLPSKLLTVLICE